MPPYRDPNALEYLRQRQPAIPTYPSELEEFGPSDEELYGLQEEATVRTPGGYQAIPSRESLKASAMQTLRRMLGLTAIEHAGRERELRIPGEYGLERERIKGVSGIEQARLRAEATRAGVAGRLTGIERQQTGALERERLQQTGMDERTNLLQRMRGQQQRTTQAHQRAQLVRQGKIPTAATGLRGFFGMSAGQSARDASADAIMKGALGGIESEIAGLAASPALRSRLSGGMSLEQALMDMNETDLTADEFAALQQELGF